MYRRRLRRLTGTTCALLIGGSGATRTGKGELIMAKLTRAQKADLRIVLRDLESMRGDALESLPRPVRVHYGNAVRTLAAILTGEPASEAIRIGCADGCTCDVHETGE